MGVALKRDGRESGEPVSRAPSGERKAEGRWTLKRGDRGGRRVELPKVKGEQSSSHRGIPLRLSHRATNKKKTNWTIGDK